MIFNSDKCFTGSITGSSSETPIEDGQEYYETSNSEGEFDSYIPDFVPGAGL